MAQVEESMERPANEPVATPEVAVSEAVPGRSWPSFRLAVSPGSQALRVILPLLAIGIFLLLWNYVPQWMGLHSYEVPTFSQDINALFSEWGTIGPNLEITITDALVGFAVGNLLAVIGAILFSQSRLIEWTFFPLTIPIIVIGPVFVIFFTVFGWGPYDPLPIIGLGSKPVLGVTILITFFPTLVNMTVGLRAIDPNLYDFMRLINASRWTILWRLRLPSSIPYLFSSFRITSTLCFVGAVVGEWMLANNTGIGGLINLFLLAINKQGLWASVLAVSVSSMAFFGIVLIAERVLVPWREER